MKNQRSNTDSGIALHYGKNNVISGNYISGTKGIGLYIHDQNVSTYPAGAAASGYNNVLIAGNIIKGSVMGSGLVLSTGNNFAVQNVMINNNVVFGNHANGLDIEAGLGVNIFNNTIYGNGAAGILVVYPAQPYQMQGVQIENNILYDPCTQNCSSHRHVQVTNTGMSGFVLMDNLYSPQSIGFTNAVDSRPLFANPLFTNAAGEDFTLKAGSPAIDAGGNVGIPFNGSAPDLGAFEYKSTPAQVNHAPVVSAGANQIITLPASANLSGTASDDGLPAGSTLTVTWSMVTGSGTVTFANVHTPATTATFSAAGTYLLQLSATDGALTSTSTVTITVNAASTVNKPPTVSAGSNQTITLPASASLSGTASDDGLPAGSTLTVTWSKVSGPGTVTFANANAKATTASFSAAGTYVLQLSATDGALTSTSSVTITVNAASPVNKPPTVSAGSNQTITLPASASLSGTASDDGLPAGSTLTVTWSKVSGPGTVTFANANAKATTASFSAAGTYVLQLSATDGALTSTSSVTITVNAASPVNKPPTVSAGSNQTITLPASAGLSGTASDDGLPAGSAMTVTWSMVTGPGTVTFANANAKATTASFSAAGTYVLQLSATDGALTSTSTVTITVNAAPPVNQPPTISAGSNQTITLPASAGLSGTASDDGLPAGSTLTVTWSKVSGPGTVTFANANAKATTASFSAAGTYVLQLSATDGALTSTSTVTITVNAAPPVNQPPTVSAGSNQTITLPASAGLSGAASDDGLPASSTLTVTWSKVSGSGTVTFANANAKATTASFSAAGTYVLQLSATDGALTSTSTVTITVNAAPQPPVVSAGSNQTITLPSTASLAGSVTGVPTGSTATITWVKTSGSGSVTFANANASSTTATFSTAGIYVLTLTASASGLSSSSSVTITVTAAPLAPVAMAWDPNAESYFAGYNVYRSTQSGFFTSAPLNGSTLLTVTSFTDFTVQNGNTYYYAVRAVSTSGMESSNSNLLQVTR